MERRFSSAYRDEDYITSTPGIYESSEPVKEAVFDYSDLVIKYLESIGVEYIFGVPGASIEPLYNAMARSERRGGLRTVVSRHEAGAAFMADGYARETGRIGVCCATSGPGATNLITGVASAYENQIPMLAITGQPPLEKLGRYALQESSCTGINVLGMFEHCTHFNSMISHPAQFEPKLITALQKAIINKGPVHLSISTDMFRSACSIRELNYNLPDLLEPSSVMDREKVQQLCDILESAVNPVFVIGVGCYEAIVSIMKYINFHEIPFVVTPEAKGLINVSHPLFYGVFGFGGHESANSLLVQKNVDHIIAVGLNIGEWATNGWSSDLLNKRLIHVDELEDRLIRTPSAHLHIYGRIQAVFSYLISRDVVESGVTPILSPLKRERFFEDSIDKYESVEALMKPQRLMRELSERVPAHSRFYADSGNGVFWAIHYLSILDRRIHERRIRLSDDPKVLNGRRKSIGGWLRLTPNFGSMGWAISSAIGTAMANKSSPVVCIVGDGSFLMHGQEISTAVAENLTIIYVILNDGAYGTVKHGQRLANAERTAYKLPDTDFAKLAEALGAKSHSIKTLNDFNALDFHEICTHKGPTLLDIYIDDEEVPPIGTRVKKLAGIIELSKVKH